MTPYRNLSGNSGIASYELGDGLIRVLFVNGGQYLYTTASAGRLHIQKMQALAAAGQGLAAYISTVVKNGYAAKEL